MMFAVYTKHITIVRFQVNKIIDRPNRYITAASAARKQQLYCHPSRVHVGLLSTHII